MTFDPFEIARSVDLVDLISNKYNLEVTSSGRVLYTSCPTGDDSSPSFAIFPEQNRFKCYHCGWFGTAIDFVMRMENLDTPVAALRHLDKIYPEMGIVNPEARTRSELVGRYFGFTEKNTNDEHARLLGSERYLTWVKTKRGFSEAAIRKFRLGIRELSGVPRLTIPLTTTGGRVLQTLTRQMSPKDPMGRYFILNVRLHPETGQIIKKDEVAPENAIPVFTKGSYLYGYDEAQGEHAYLVEGQLDRIAAWELGVDDVMAYGTMKVSDDQAEQLGRFQSITLIPDLGVALDEVINNVRTIRMAHPTMSINIVDMSPWKDAEIENEPDFVLKDINDMLRYLSVHKDEKLFKELVANAVPVEFWLYNRYVAPVTPTPGRAFIELQRIMELATAPVARVQLVKIAATDLDLPAELLLHAR